jgi:hypothetical protein
MSFDDYSQQMKEYLLKVSELQKFLGFDGEWKEALLKQSQIIKFKENSKFKWKV